MGNIVNFRHQLNQGELVIQSHHSSEENSDSEQDDVSDIIPNIPQFDLYHFEPELTEEEKQEIYSSLELIISNEVQPIDFDLQLKKDVICAFGIYTGQYLNDQKSGIGKLLLPNNEYYHGFWQNDKPNGLGRLFLGHEHIYEGNFLDGEFHGHGTYFMRLYKYKGNWVNGKREGTGYEKYIEGNSEDLNSARKIIYYGEFNDDEKNGNGTLILMKDEKSYVKFDGSFVMGKMEAANFYINDKNISGIVMDDCKKLISISLPDMEIDIDFDYSHESNQLKARLCINKNLVLNFFLEDHSFFVLSDNEEPSFNQD